MCTCSGIVQCAHIDSSQTHSASPPQLKLAAAVPDKYRLYHAVEVYTGMYKTAETGLETRARSARVSKVSKVLCIPIYTDTGWYKVFMPCRCTRHVHAMAPAV